MKLWLDSINLSLIEDALRKGICFGITTNPSLLSCSQDLSQTVEALLRIQNGPVAIQVTSHDPCVIVRQAQMLFSFSKRIVVKIPVTSEGLIAMKSLQTTNIPILATGILTLEQALLALQLDVAYMALYVKYMENPIQTVEKIAKLCGRKTEVMAAALPDKKMLLECFALGCGSATIKQNVLQELFEEEGKTKELTDNLLKAFDNAGLSLEKSIQASEFTANLSRTVSSQK